MCCFVQSSITPILQIQDKYVDIRPRDIRLGVFVEKLFGFVDLGRQVGASATIRVVKQHELAVLLADFVLVQCALPMQNH